MFRDAFIALAREVVDRSRMRQHYFHLGEEHWRRHLAGLREVPLKKLFYALRPAAALRWLRERPEEPVLPMHLPALLGGCGAPDSLKREVEHLILRKSFTREIGFAPIPPAIDAFLTSEFERAKTDLAPLAKEPLREPIDAFFREWIRKVTPA